MAVFFLRRLGGMRECSKTKGEILLLLLIVIVMPFPSIFGIIGIPGGTTGRRASFPLWGRGSVGPAKL